MITRYRLPITIFLLFPAFFAIVTLGWLLSIPSDPKNSLLLGLSASRLAIAGVLLALALIFSVPAWLAWKRTESFTAWLTTTLDRHALALFLVGAGAFFGMTTLLALPGKYLGEYHAIYERLRPLFSWACLTSFQMTLGLLLWFGLRNKTRLAQLFPGKNTILATGITFACFLAAWTFIAVTKIGVGTAQDYWSRPAVPILWSQTLVTLLTGVLIAVLRPGKKWLDLALPGVIAILAILLWTNQSYLPGTFDTPARPPVNEIFPINDSFIFDVAAQKLLTGQGLIYEAIDKPLYIAHIALLHLLDGGSYQTFYRLQVIFFSLIPVVGYFLGKELHSRSLGTSFGLLLVIKETNAITLTNYLSVSTTKMILSEPLTTLGVLLFTLFLVKTLKKPDTSNPALWVSGGLLGLTSLVRLNSATILPAAILALGIALKLKAQALHLQENKTSTFRWKTWFALSAVLSTFALVTFLPWMTRNTVISGNPFSFIESKTSGVLVEQRYKPVITTQPEPNSPQTQEEPVLAKYLLLGKRMLTHYLHNLVSVTIMLPPTPAPNTLFDMLRLPMWKSEWDGSLAPAEILMLVCVLGVSALGIGNAWSRWQAGGLAPLFVALGYNLSTAISLTSGGRYLVPFEWVLIFYFLIGMIEIIRSIGLLFGKRELLAQETSLPLPVSAFTPTNISQLTGIVLLFLFLGSLPVLFELSAPQRYHPNPTYADFTQATSRIQPLDDLQPGPKALILNGRALYPRYYAGGEGETPELFDPLIGPMDYDRLTFFVAGPAGGMVVLAMDSIPEGFIPGADAWVLGCPRQDYIEAITVVLKKSSTTNYFLSPTLKNCD